MTSTFIAKVTKVVHQRRLLIAEHAFTTEQAARDYLRAYHPRHGYETSVRVYPPITVATA